AKGEATGTAIRDNVRKISQGSGVKVESAVEGLKLLSQGKAINFEGASGPCDFTQIGDILGFKFRYAHAPEGKCKPPQKDSGAPTSRPSTRRAQAGRATSPRSGASSNAVSVTSRPRRGSSSS